MCVSLLCGNVIGTMEFRSVYKIHCNFHRSTSIAPNKREVRSIHIIIEQPYTSLMDEKRRAQEQRTHLEDAQRKFENNQGRSASLIEVSCPTIEKVRVS